MFGFALVPDLVCYLRIDVETLALRVIETKAMNYWESGMDLRLGNDLYDSFKKYQSLLIKEFERCGRKFPLRDYLVIDALQIFREMEAPPAPHDLSASTKKAVFDRSGRDLPP